MPPKKRKHADAIEPTAEETQIMRDRARARLEDDPNDPEYRQRLVDRDDGGDLVDLFGDAS